jgi:hypothetical protein
MLATLIFIAGLLHFGILIASALVPQVLDWRSSLAKLDPLLRQLIWVHGAFIVLVIIGFGAISLLYANQLASGEPLARGIAAMIAIFWGARLAVQFFVFDAKPYLRGVWLKLGYHGLTLVFTWIAVVLAVAAIRPTPL